MPAGKMLIGQSDLVNNPTTRLPVCLCLDTSGSMNGEPIKELNDGVRLFYDALKKDEVALYAAEICVVTFGGEATLVSDFANIDQDYVFGDLLAYGGTPMGEAVNLALDRLEARKKEYKANGVDSFHPWLVLMTDGAPNGEASELERAIARCAEMSGKKRMMVFPIGVGNEADMAILRRFSPNFPPLKLRGLAFKEFFAWLSKSVSTASQSMPGEAIKLDKEGANDWTVPL